MRSSILPNNQGSIVFSNKIKIPLENWPDYLIEVSIHRNEFDKNVCETIERIIGKFSSDDFKIWYGQNHPDGFFSETCKCNSKRREWADKFIY